MNFGTSQFRNFGSI